MHVLVVHAHPEPTSFNRALTETAIAAVESAGHSVEVSDLFAEEFNPVAGRHDFLSVADPDRFHYQNEQEQAARSGSFAPDIRREQNRLRAADLLILQFPLWWGSPPAIMKGWFERVLAYGFAYVDGRRFEKGLLKGRRALLGVTTGGTVQRFSDSGVYGDIDRVLWPVRRLTLEYMGLTVEEPFVCYGTPRIDEAMRQDYLGQWECRVVEALARHETMQDRVIAAAESLQPIATSRNWSTAG